MLCQQALRAAIVSLRHLAMGAPSLHDHAALLRQRPAVRWPNLPAKPASHFG
jgi:hypothetical protein